MVNRKKKPVNRIHHYGSSLIASDQNGLSHSPTLAQVPKTKLQIRKLTHKIRFDEKLLCWQILDVIQSDGKGLAGGYRAYGKKIILLHSITSEQKKMILLLSNHRIKDLGIYKTISAERPYDPNRYTYIFFPIRK